MEFEDGFLAVAVIITIEDPDAKLDYVEVWEDVQHFDGWFRAEGS